MTDSIADREFKETGQIVDRAGRRYHLSISTAGSLCFFKLYDGKICAGYANCEIIGRSFRLCDLQIEDAVPCGCLSFIQTNYRKRGLGTLVLDHVINRARTLGLQQVIGEIVQRDVEDTPNLHAWYRHRGFTVTPVNGREDNVVATLCLDLQAKDKTSGCENVG